MKKTFTYLLFSCLLGTSPMAALAQTPLEINRGQTVDLVAADGYESYQWQVSSDKKNYVDLPNGKVQQMHLRLFAPGYYRVKVTDAEKKTS